MRTQSQYIRENGVASTVTRRLRMATAVPNGLLKMTLAQRVEELMRMTPYPLRRGVFWHNVLLLHKDINELEALLDAQLLAALSSSDYTRNLAQ